MSRRLEILRRAAEVFEKKGVTQTSIEDIAQAVGIKREGIYYYFSSRTDILVEIILPISKNLSNNLATILRTDMTSREKLRAAIRSQLDYFNPGYLEMTVALRENHFNTEDKRMQELRDIWHTYTAQWESLVVEGQTCGEFNQSLHPKVAAFAYLGMCNWVSRWFHPDGKISLDEIIDSYCTLATDGLMAAPELASLEAVSA